MDCSSTAMREDMDMEMESRAVQELQNTQHGRVLSVAATTQTNITFAIMVAAELLYAIAGKIALKTFWPTWGLGHHFGIR